MKILIVGPKGKLSPSEVENVIVEFSDHRKLKITDSKTPMPEEIPEGISVWGLGNTAHNEYEQDASRLNITPVATNGIIVLPHDNCGHYVDVPVSKLDLEISITPYGGGKQRVVTSSILIELKNGKTLELLEDYARRGLLIWGGREPESGLPIEEVVKRTEGIGVSPLAANVIHVFPYKIHSVVIS
ncbi:hypothetical protein [Enterobacter ludwigii]|uniref:hypothetical protein n=1 Tax=Enterobacter ludwigii TaxID=299767 RepID=UPI0003D7E50C|nr:hypothetical protein [Enterobacter ludwigii]AHE73057.1 hypothetical protein M942_13320 [Enterobacter ludwigii]